MWGIEARTSHLRTRRGEHEVDLIVVGRGGQLVALEVKLGASICDADVRHLVWLRDQMDDQAEGARGLFGPQSVIEMVPAGPTKPGSTSPCAHAQAGAERNEWLSVTFHVTKRDS